MSDDKPLLEKAYFNETPAELRNFVHLQGEWVIPMEDVRLAVRELQDIFDKSLDNLTAYYGGNKDSRFLSPKIVSGLLVKVRKEVFGEVEE